MMYLSKGIARKRPATQELCVSHCGVSYMLSGLGSQLWRAGQFHLKEAQEVRQLKHLEKLQQLGLVEVSEETGVSGAYQILSQCIICPAKPRPDWEPLLSTEHTAWKWISAAGLRLTIGELTKLFTENVLPTPALLGKENTRALVLALYAGNSGLDTTLELQMAHAPKRDKVVNAVLGLLSKKRIILI